MINDKLLHAYTLHEHSFREAGTRLEAVLSNALSRCTFKIHSLTWRVKPFDSFRYKISRPDKTYDEIWDVTDVLGIRVTTYFEDEVDAVAEMVEKIFRVDFARSVDKRTAENDATFGYKSLHYVCELDESIAPSELVRAGARFEIQIRTVLQHAWAEIEHDLGYKATASIPTHLRRRFSRVASLLEIADEEFVSIRRGISEYKAEIEGRILEGDTNDPAQPIPLDMVSLEAFARSPEVAKVDAEIAELLAKPSSEDVFFPEYLLRMLRLAGLRDVDETRRALAACESRIRSIVLPYFDFAQKAYKIAARDLDRIQAGYSLFFLAHVVVVQSRMLELSKVERLARFYRELDYPDDPKAAHNVAAALITRIGEPNVG